MLPPSAGGGGGSSQRAKAALVGAETLRALEALLGDAVAQAQGSGDLPAAHSWAPFTVAAMASARAATHYTSSVLKAVQAYNAAHHPQRLAAALAARKPKAKKQRVRGENGDTTTVRAAVDDTTAAAAAETAAAASATGSAATPQGDDAAAIDDPTLPFGDAQDWAETIGRHVTRLLGALGPEHTLHGRVSCDVPAPEASVRGPGFIDFTVQPDTPASNAAAQSAAAAASSSSTSAIVTPAAAAVAVPAAPTTATFDSADPSSSSLSTATSFTFHSIGTISSVFKLKYGTPRQGTIAPAARGTFTLSPSIPASALEGLEEYSHVWLVFVFHANSNKQFRPKVEPPRAGGRKMGVFATRSPHRLNPLGLSLVRLERVEGRTLHLSALDLIEGTPVVDLKPYHPADCVPDYTIPLWMREQAEVKPPFAVTLSAEAQAQLGAMVAHRQLEFYTSYDDAVAGVCESVSHDPRPIYVRARASKAEVYGFRLDRMNVLYRVDDDDKRVDVLAVQYVDYDKLLQEQREEARAEQMEGTAAAGAGAGAALSVEERITKRFLAQRPKQSFPAVEAQAATAAGEGSQDAAAPAAAAPAASSSSGASMDAQ